jgi:membrane protease YdiL (CAAX protease family)
VVPLVLLAQVLNRQLLEALEVTGEVPYSMVFFHSAGTFYEEIAMVLLVAGLAPVAEELFFRGVLYRAFGEFFPVGIAALLSALVFASSHFTLQQFLPLAVLGYFLAHYYENTNSLVTPITMHTLQNTSSLLILYVI